MEQRDKNNTHEVWATILMSLTALLTAWCAYQANLWTGMQEFSLAAAQEHEVLASREHLSKNESYLADSILSMFVLESLAEGRTNTVEHIIARVRPELGATFKSWLATNPLVNRQAPAHPLLMPDYQHSVLQRFREKENHLHQQMIDEHRKARSASGASDSYILFTVILAIVLFFGGITSTLHAPKVKTALLSVTTCIFLCTAIAIFLAPISS